MEAIIFFGSIALVVVFFVLYGKRRERKRIESLRREAGRKGYPTVGELARELRTIVLSPPFVPVSGDSAKIPFWMQVQNSWFTEGHYSVRRGKSTSHHRFCAYIHPLDRELPEFILREEGLFDKAAAFFGYDDIDFEAHLEFSKRFHLSGFKRQEIEAFFKGGPIRRIKGLPNTIVAVRGTYLVVAQEGNRLTADELDAVLHYLRSTAQLFL